MYQKENMVWNQLPITPYLHLQMDSCISHS